MLLYHVNYVFNAFPGSGKYFKKYLPMLCLVIAVSFVNRDEPDSWIRINQLGYLPAGIKVAVWVGKSNTLSNTFQLLDAVTNKIVFTNKTSVPFGSYGPFTQSYRLNFSRFSVSGSYYIRMGNTQSPVFNIAKDVYAGSADFCLRYMRQQRSGFNPFLKDSCHTTDGYTMYGPMPDSTHLDVSGGWHDATDYLQYVTTSATATYHLLAAYRDFPGVFSDTHLANGLEGFNGTADVLDEARWGLEWLLKMHPRKDWLFNQLADDRDHAGMRLPTLDSVDYGLGKGKGRPVYFATGQPQGLGKYKNKSTGVASTAGKFSSAFSLAAQVYATKDTLLKNLFEEKALSAYRLGIAQPGVSQTAPNREPYYYEEDNWVDDMELAAVSIYQLTGNKEYLNQGLHYSSEEKVTPWMGADTARHYQWYPFHNFGHYELAKKEDPATRALLAGYYKMGIDKVWQKAKANAFYRGVPFVWCSNNLNTSFAIQCYLYRKLTNDQQYTELEQSCFDWLFGCNPWGTSMVFGLPANGVTPKDPHSSLSYLYHYPLDGGLMDGPVYGSIYKRLLGIKLTKPDAFASFQSDLVVYHDDSGDYSTDEPTMDGTASLVYLLAEKEYESGKRSSTSTITDANGAITRGDISQKKISLVFTGDEFADGGEIIRTVLKKNQAPGSFFLTGNFYQNPNFKQLVKSLKQDRHYLGAHSNKHLLYCDWTKRDSLLVTEQQFKLDLDSNYYHIASFGIMKDEAPYFLPPYEWYNSSIAKWTNQSGLHLINYTPGTFSTADYTYPQMEKGYRSSEEIYKSIINYETTSAYGLNGFILLVHIGTDPRRTDKFYNKLEALIIELKSKGYEFVTLKKMLNK